MIRKTLVAIFMAIATVSGAFAQKETVFNIEGSKGGLHTILQQPEMKKGEKVPVVILCHGFAGNCHGRLFDDIVADLLNEGIATVKFDFNGHGESEGLFQDMTVLNEIEDLKKVVEWVKGQDWVESISLLGHSQGGVVAGMTAGELGAGEIKSLVLLAPAAVLRDDAIRGNTMGAFYDPWNMKEDYVTLPMGNLKLGRKYIESAVNLPIYETSAKYTGPVLIIHGTYDRVVPFTYGERYDHEYKNSKLIIIEGVDHGFSADTAKTARLAADWLLTQTK